MRSQKYLLVPLFYALCAGQMLVCLRFMQATAVLLKVRKRSHILCPQAHPRLLWPAR